MRPHRRPLLLCQLLAPAAHGGLLVTMYGAQVMKNFSDDFDQEVRAQTSRGGRILLIDIGANNGGWSNKKMRHLHSRAEKIVAANYRHHIELILCEPQEQFRVGLQRLADRWHGTFISAAAWIEDTKLAFTSNWDSQRAGIKLEQQAPPEALAAEAMAAEPANLTRAINLVKYLDETLPAHALTYLKLDIEGAEYAVLPRLLMSGVLCRVSFMHVEWHLNNLPLAQRFDGFALRKAFDSLLKAGCATNPGGRPKRFLHEEYRTKNFDELVPGLWEEGARHARPGKSWKQIPPAEGFVKYQGVSYHAEVNYSRTTKFYTYINGV